MSVATSAQIVTFRLGEDLFAADINDVERVLRYAEPTPVPNVPSWVQGVIEYRSQVVPVVDLRIRFELPAAAPNGATRIMVLSTNGEWIAAVVDAVLEVVPLGKAQLAPPPPLFDGLSAEFLRGILRRNDRLIIVLDVARLLATKERLAFDRALLSAVPASPPAVPVPEASPEAAPGDTAMSPSPGEFTMSPAAAEGDLLIIRGSHDPATTLELLGSSEGAPRPEGSSHRATPLPHEPGSGASPLPRATGPVPEPEDDDSGRSDG
jgi:purine-binding chemotaxis protein CheW